VRFYSYDVSLQVGSRVRFGWCKETRARWCPANPLAGRVTMIRNDRNGGQINVEPVPYTNWAPNLFSAYSNASKILRTYRYVARGGAVGSGTALHTVKLRVPFPIVSFWFFIDIIFQAALWVWGLNRYEYQAAGARGWQPYHLHLPIVMKCGSFNLLENSGFVQAYTGFAITVLHADTDLRDVSLLVAKFRKAAIFFMFVCLSV
jgi:hypothetical protein